MDKREAKKVYEISKLNDPNVGEWEKERIRVRYKLVEDLPYEFFNRKLSKDEIHIAVKFIESNLVLVRQQRISYQVPDSINSVLALYSFESYLESDGFWVYSDQGIKNHPESDELHQERLTLLKSLISNGMSNIAKQLEGLWVSGVQDESGLKKLQQECWNKKFTDNLIKQLGFLIKDSENSIVELRNLAKNGAVND